MSARVASLAALVTAAAHLPLAASHLHDGPLLALALLVLAAGCLHCARSLCAEPGPREWATALAMAAAMVAVHAPGSPLAHPHAGASAVLAVVAGAAELLLLALAAAALLTLRRAEGRSAAA